MTTSVRLLVASLIASNVAFGLLLAWQVRENYGLKSEATELRRNSPAALLAAERERYPDVSADLVWTTIRDLTELEILCGPPVNETPVATYWQPRHPVQLTTSPGSDPLEIKVRAQLPTQRTKS